MRSNLMLLKQTTRTNNTDCWILKRCANGTKTSLMMKPLPYRQVTAPKLIQITKVPICCMDQDQKFWLDWNTVHPGEFNQVNRTKTEDCSKAVTETFTNSTAHFSTIISLSANRGLGFGVWGLGFGVW